MKEYFIEHFGLRFKDIFTFTSNKWYYVLGKILCIIVGLPIYLVLIPLDIVNFLIYCLFSWIPYVSVFFLFICKVLTIVFGLGYYICILPDAKSHIEQSKIEYQKEMDEMREALDKDNTDNDKDTLNNKEDKDNQSNEQENSQSNK